VKAIHSAAESHHGLQEEFNDSNAFYVISGTEIKR